ncbi:MAG: tetratricopeptide repeat protein [Proteobacteria bacterium]|nr:tetratricopeptide repeat protein [Pseudomonadota bacterium]
MLNKVLMAFVLSLALATQTWAAGSSSKSTKRASTYDIAEKAVKAGDYKRAIPLLRKVLAKNSNHYDAMNYLGFSHRQLGENDIALDYYKKVLAMKPEHRGANEYLGELYLKEGKLDLAKKQLARLDKICTFGCKEFDDLKAAIKVYSAGGGFTGFSKQPQSAN